MIGLIKPYDPTKQSHIWFVDNGDAEGFMPAEVLTPYEKHTDNSDLIELNDDLSSKNRTELNHESKTELRKESSASSKSAEDQVNNFDS